MDTAAITIELIATDAEEPLSWFSLGHICVVGAMGIADSRDLVGGAMMVFPTIVDMVAVIAAQFPVPCGERVETFSAGSSFALVFEGMPGNRIATHFMSNVIDIEDADTLGRVIVKGLSKQFARFDGKFGADCSYASEFPSVLAEFNAKQGYLE
ncbi:hypothetical protein YTPLAS18_40600 [Nitrospira sp.]|nr:hypothetical protein YTPLAS18_40600 [Nitrospira sp.]